MSDGIVVFSGTPGNHLAQRLCRRFCIKHGAASVGRFHDGEVKVEIHENVRNDDVFIINPTNPPYENLLELYMLARSAKMASARTVTVIAPYLGYNRQDRKPEEARGVISAGIPIQQIVETKADRVVLIDVHSPATLIAFEPMPVEHMYASFVAVPRLIKEIAGRPFVVASPDRGGGPRAIKYAKLLGQEDFVICEKFRSAPGEIEKVKVVGDVRDKIVVFVDDMIDTGGTIVANAAAVKRVGAREVLVFATHGLFSKDAMLKIAASEIDRVFVTDTVYHEPKRLLAGMNGKLEIISIEELLGRTIMNLVQNKSLSSLRPRPGDFADLIVSPQIPSGMNTLLDQVQGAKKPQGRQKRRQAKRK